MSASNEIDSKGVAHLPDHVLSKDERGAAGVRLPALERGLGIGPEEVDAHRRIRRILRTRNLLQLVQTLQLWRQSAVHAQDSVANQTAQRHPVERVLKAFPN